MNVLFIRDVTIHHKTVKNIYKSVKFPISNSVSLLQRKGDFISKIRKNIEYFGVFV